MIEDFLEEEIQKVKGLDKFLGNYPTIKRTSQIIGSLPRTIQEVTVVRPSVIGKIVAIWVGLIASIMWLSMLGLLVGGRSPIIAVLALSFLSFILYKVLGTALFNRKYVFTIILDREGITVHDQKTKWTDLAETCIMVRRVGRGNNSTLVLFLKDGSVERYDLYNFTIPDRTLAGLIEHYKK